LEVKDDVQLADVAIVFVHLLHIAVDYLKGNEFVVCRGAASDEEEGGISTIDYFGIWVSKSAEHDMQSLL